MGKKNKIEEKDCCLCLTVPPVMPDFVSERYGEMIFEDMGFDACFIAPSCQMAFEYAYRTLDDFNENLALVIDSGFSFTYATPIMTGNPLRYAST